MLENNGYYLWRRVSLFFQRGTFEYVLKNNDMYKFEGFKHEWMNDIKESMLLLSNVNVRWTVNFETSQQESR